MTALAIHEPIIATLPPGPEQDVLARILRRAPEVAKWLVGNLLGAPWDGVKPRRYYLAHAPGASMAVLRLKDAAGLEEWRGRVWQLFDAPVTIADVTVPALELVERILALSFREQDRAALWVELGPAIRFEAHPPRTRPESVTALPLWQPAPDLYADFDIPGPGPPMRDFHSDIPRAREPVTHNHPCGHAIDGNTIVLVGGPRFGSQSPTISPSRRICGACARRPDCQRPDLMSLPAREQSNRLAALEARIGLRPLTDIGGLVASHA